MPQVKEVPAGLRPYVFHGLDLAPAGGEQCRGDCPLCGKPGHWHAHGVTGLWDCKACGARGNPVSFLRQLWEAAGASNLETLAEERRLLSAESLVRWGVRASPLTGEPLVPGYGAGGKLDQLYVYRHTWVPERRAWKMILKPTPGVWPEGKAHALYGIPPLVEPARPTVYVCEGPWDGMALWEVLEGSSDRTASVLAVPGCNVWRDEWVPLLAGKVVVLLYDNDYPRRHPQTGNTIPPAGLAGMRRVAAALAQAAEAPAEIKYLAWGPEGYDPALPNGHDVRDWLAAGGATAEGRAAQLTALLAKAQPVPAEWLAGRDLKAPRKAPALELLECSDWQTLRTAWRKSGLLWTPGLDRTLAAMLATALSTKCVGDQLWVRIISPASTGKTTLCEALGTCRQYVFQKDTMTGLVSGFQDDKEGSTNHSLVEKIRNKTLVIKDADTVLSEPGLTRILAQFRATYDRSIRAQYGNKMSQDFEGVDATVILCGTPALHQLDSSEVGERFLTVSMMDGIDDELEDEILLRKAYQAERLVGLRSNGLPETQSSPEMVRAMRLTGGYVRWLREEGVEQIAAVEFPHGLLRHTTRLGKFVAYFRARPSKRQEETAEREFAPRLVSQLIRLAKCLAVVTNRPAVDEAVMAEVRQVVLDSSRGRSLTLARLLYPHGLKGLPLATVVDRCHSTEDKKRVLLTFLRRIRVVETVRERGAGGTLGRIRWRLTAGLRKLYGEVMGVGEGGANG